MSGYLKSHLSFSLHEPELTVELIEELLAVSIPAYSSNIHPAALTLLGVHRFIFPCIAVRLVARWQCWLNHYGIWTESALTVLSPAPRSLSFQRPLHLLVPLSVAFQTENINRPWLLWFHWRHCELHRLDRRRSGSFLRNHLKTSDQDKIWLTSWLRFQNRPIKSEH